MKPTKPPPTPEVRKMMVLLDRILEDAQEVMGRGLTEDELFKMADVIGQMETDAAMLDLWKQHKIRMAINDEGEVVWGPPLWVLNS
jgi:hypothetical protein